MILRSQRIRYGMQMDEYVSNVSHASLANELSSGSCIRTISGHLCRNFIANTAYLSALFWIPVMVKTKLEGPRTISGHLSHLYRKNSLSVRTLLDSSDGQDEIGGRGPI